MDSPETQLTSVRQFLAEADATAEQLAQTSQSGSFRSLRDSLSKKAPGFKLPESFYEQMFNQVLDLLDIAIPEQIGNAWSRYQEFRKYRDPEEYPQDETFLVPLAEHAITFEYSPSVEPMVNDVSLGEVTFAVSLEVTFKAMILKIRAGRILDIAVGSCEATGLIAWEDATLLERESEPIALPGVMEFEDGILIYDPSRDIAEDDTKVAGTSEDKEPLGGGPDER